jgi:hypothetical protein
VDSHNTKWIGSRNLVLFNETGIPSETEDLLMPRPSLLKNYPNPFQESTAICYDKSSTSPIRISIYNLKGQSCGSIWMVKINRKKGSDLARADKQGKNCAAGIYLITVEDQGQTRFGRRETEVVKKNGNTDFRGSHGFLIYPPGTPKTP